MPLLKNKIFLSFLILALISYCAIEAQGNGDFFIFSSAAGDLSSHIDIYKKSYFDSYHYYYSVLFAIFLNPFYTIPFYPVKLAWLFLNVFLFFHLMYLLYQSEPIKNLDQKQRTWFMSIAFVFAFRFFHQNIHASQITILILWCCIYGLLSIHSGNTIRGAAILALGINIKLLPIVFLPYLLYRGYFKAFVFCVLFYASALILPSFIIGHAYNMSLLSSWFDLINPTNQMHVLDVDERSFHGLSTLLSTLLVAEVPDPLALDIPRNILDISIPALTRVLLLVRLALVSFTLYFLHSLPFKRAESDRKQTFEIAYILLIIPLIFPHQQHYAFLFIVPAFLCCLLYLVENYTIIKGLEKKTLILLFVIVYLCSSLSLLLGEFEYYYQHFKILSYGALILIPLLAWVFRRSNRLLVGHTP